MEIRLFSLIPPFYLPYRAPAADTPAQIQRAISNAASAVAFRAARARREEYKASYMSSLGDSLAVINAARARHRDEMHVRVHGRASARSLTHSHAMPYYINGKKYAPVLACDGAPRITRFRGRIIEVRGI